MRTREEVITAAVLPTSDVYLGNDPHHAHAIAVMAVMALVGLKVAVYIGNRDFYFALPSDIRLYTFVEPRDGDAMPMAPGSFTPGVAVDSGVHYDAPGVPYKPAVVVPFTECPESADSHSMVQQGNIILILERGARVAHKGVQNLQ